jgi:sigma-E factor negative regulatory protein RseC
MIEETGRVVAVNGDEVWIETVRNSSCSGCSARSGCGQGLLAKIKDGRRNHIRLHTGLKLVVDDEVILGLPDQAFIRSSFLAYGLPLFALIMAVVVADKWFGFSEPWVIGSAFIGLLTGFLGVRLISQSGTAQNDFEPVIVKIIPIVQSPSGCDIT